MLPLKTTSNSFQRLLGEAPYLSRCSDNKTAMLVRPRHYAVRWPYMQVNRKDMCSWLVFDIDHEDQEFPNPYIWQDEGLPAPNLIVRNRHDNKAHLYYAIVSVCTSDNARSQPIQYLKAVYQAMALRMKADQAYSGPVAKTPFHPWWQTTELHSQVYELGELADSVDLETPLPWGEAAYLNDVSHSRNCTLFEHSRHYAYSIIRGERREGSYESFKRRICHYATYKNYSFEGKTPLRHSEVMSVVKSVSRWTWDKYYAGSKVKRGVMNLPSDLNTKQRQSLAAARTHQIRREKTKERIINACRLLLQKGEELNITTVAKATRFCRKTVRRYFYDIHSFVKPSEGVGILPISSLLRLMKSGPYAVHQITAVEKDPLVDTSEKCKAISSSRAPQKWAAYLNVIDG
ncbi:replication initiation protein [Vibrio sp. EA2]|uniref:replication initiation protein n=1 Tax=Vibrio sp. EA2 TaxID=3079860 RepID=UPI00294A0DCB|nr:replication initiation protein [Vibrio sp. EA2]MDV6252839.1 replication initiation protein [Vibrio sp. EA2]